MKIDYPKTTNCLNFDEIHAGCVFKFKEKYYIKVIQDGKPQALSLENYCNYYMPNSAKIEPYFASRLVIEKQ